jgi:hypothetical protein
LGGPLSKLCVTPPFVREGGGALKKIAPSGGRREKCWGISCENHDFIYDQNIK